MPDVIIDGHSTHYEVDDFADPWRAADTIWIQHGFGRSSKFWYHWVPLLAGQYRVLRRDMPGHGRSADPGSDYPWTLEAVLDDMLRFLDALDLRRVHYVGESAGGLFGMAFAARYPDRLKSLILCSSPPIVRKATIDELVKPLGLASQQAALDELPMSDFVRNSVKQRMLTAVSSDHVEWLIGEWSKNRSHVLNSLTKLLDTIDMTPQLGRIKVPTLILAPTRSPIASLASQRKMARMIPNSELVEIPGVGHETYVDQAHVCTSAIKSFLERI